MLDIAIVNGQVLQHKPDSQQVDAAAAPCRKCTAGNLNAFNPRYPVMALERLTVGIKGDKIVFVGEGVPPAASRIIDAAEKIVSPGFIDMHSHTDELLSLKGESKLRQGVTTEIIGNCGFSAAPVAGELLEEHQAALEEYGLNITWSDFTGFNASLQAGGMLSNVVHLVGQGNLRGMVMGNTSRAATPAEIQQMQELLAQSLRQGARGLSTGLIYAPGCFAATDELSALASVLRAHNGIYTTHMRSESRNLIAAVQEALEIGRQAQVPVEVSHLKAFGQPNWGKVTEALKLIGDAAQNPPGAGFDLYPYTASCTGLDSLLPQWALEGGREACLGRIESPVMREQLKAEIESERKRDWRKILISEVTPLDLKYCEGKSLADLAQAEGSEPLDFALDLLLRARCEVSAIYGEMCDQDVENVLRHPLGGIGSDASARSTSGILSRGKPHPRAFGTFPRVLAEYVRNKGLLSWAEALYKMSGIPAARFNLPQRGSIAVGGYADIVVLDPLRVKDTATYSQPQVYPEGIDYVLVNGVPAVCEGEYTGATPGRIL